MTQKIELLRRLVFFLLFALVVSCGDQLPDRIAGMSTREIFDLYAPSGFSDLVKQCPRIELPCHLYCGDCCGPGTNDKFNPRLLKYMPEGATLKGKIMHESGLAVFLVTYAGDMIIPAICVFNMGGQLRDERLFMTGWCGRDFGYLGNQHFIISENFVFSEIDTNYTFLMDTANAVILDTVETEIIRHDYVVDDGGRIVEQTRDTVMINGQILIECRHDDRIACINIAGGDTIVPLTNYYREVKYDDLNGDHLTDICISIISNAPDQCDYYLFNSTKKNHVYLENCINEQTRLSGTDLYFSYHSEGCAGADWSSELSKIENDTLVRIGYLSGSNCDEDPKEKWVVEAYKPVGNLVDRDELVEKKAYDEFILNDQNRYEYIRKYWINNHARFE